MLVAVESILYNVPTEELTRREKEKHIPTIQQV
jgi:hypothetical protein